MDTHWQIYTLIFGAVFLAFQGVRGFLADRSQSRRASKRFSAIEGVSRNRKEVELLKERSLRGNRGGVLTGLRRLLIQSGTNLSIRGLSLCYAIVAAVLYVPCHTMGEPIGLTLSGVGSGALLLVILRRKRAKRIAKFGEQLPDVLDIMVRSLRAGHPVAVSMSLVGREMPGPAGPEFTLLCEEITYGRDFREALENLSDRVGHPDVRFLITSMAIARQTGGNLGEILSRLSKLIRQRFKLKRKIRALSAEGRFGGYILSITPVLIFSFVSLFNPGYYREFWGTSMQNTMFEVALGLLVAGNLTIYRMVNFKV